MMMIGSLLFAALLFDTFGDQGGVKLGWILALQTWAFPILIWGCGAVDWKQIYQSICGRAFLPSRQGEQKTKQLMDLSSRSSNNPLQH
jgi:hypothetical protein